MNALDELKQAALYATTDAQRQAFERVHNDVAELIAERDRLTNIVRSHEKQIERMAGELDELTIGSAA